MLTFTAVTTMVVMLCNLLPILCHSKLASSAAFIVPSATQLYRGGAATNCRNTSCDDRQTIIIGASKASQEPTTINNKIESEEAVTDVTKVDYEQSQSIKNNNNINNSEISWKPPSQKTIGKIFKIQQPQDLLDFVIEDERLSIIKVYASWCKTCKVFDVRYRKLANQMGDLSTGNVRFAEMQYDNPANEEMCKLLNATQLPYILIYKGSQGKVADFQCGPAKFQMLIDTVRGLLGESSNDIMKDGNYPNTEVRDSVQTSSDKISSGVVGANSTTANSNISDEVNRLKDQLTALENEKIEMFELMKSQIEVDKEEIQKLVNGVTIQKSIIEGKDDEIQKLSGVIELKDGELARLTEGMDQKVKEYTVLEEKVELYKRQVEELTTRLDKSEKTIVTMQANIALHEKEVKEWERQMKEHESDWERERLMYEEERSSVRKLVVLSVKSMGKKVRSFLAREK